MSENFIIKIGDTVYFADAPFTVVVVSNGYCELVYYNSKSGSFEVFPRTVPSESLLKLER